MRANPYYSALLPQEEEGEGEGENGGENGGEMFTTDVYYDGTYTGQVELALLLSPFADADRGDIVCIELAAVSQLQDRSALI